MSLRVACVCWVCCVQMCGWVSMPICTHVEATGQWWMPFSVTLPPPYSLEAESPIEPGSGLETRNLNDPLVCNPHNTGVVGKCQCLDFPGGSEAQTQVFMLAQTASAPIHRARFWPLSNYFT